MHQCIHTNSTMSSTKHFLFPWMRLETLWAVEWLASLHIRCYSVPGVWKEAVPEGRARNLRLHLCLLQPSMFHITAASSTLLYSSPPSLVKYCLFFFFFFFFFRVT